MKRISNLAKKREFILWFLNKHQLKNPDLARLLKLISDHDDLLKRVRFVENIRYHSDAVLVSAEDAKTIPYIMRLDNEYYFDVDEFINKATNNLPNKLYLWLSFNKDFICGFCPHVLEKRTAKTLSKKHIRSLEREISEQVLLKESAREKLLDQIDKALEKGSKDDFFRLTHQLKKIQG